MRRTILVFGFLLAALLPASAEEFVLKDGTKIQGRMVAIKGDKIEVQTAYGKMQIRPVRHPYDQLPGKWRNSFLAVLS